MQTDVSTSIRFIHDQIIFYTCFASILICIVNVETGLNIVHFLQISVCKKAYKRLKRLNTSLSYVIILVSCTT